MKKRIAFFLWSLTSVLLVNAQEVLDKEYLTVEKIWKDYEFFGSGVSGFRSMKDGEHYSRFTMLNNVKSILKYSFTETAKAGEVILDGNQLVYNGKKINVVDYAFNEDETKLLLMVNKKQRYRRSYFAEYFLYDLEKNILSPLDETRSPQTLASYSPDGKKVAYIFQNNLYVKNIETGIVTAVTNDGAENKIINGTTDWVYEEEFAITKAYDWSPNSEYIGFLKFDETNVKAFTMMEYSGLYPEPVTFKYPKAGEENSVVTLCLANIASKPVTINRITLDEYIPRIKFSSVENKLMAITLNRHQNHLRYFSIDALSEDKTEMLIYEEKDKAYLEIDDNLYFLEDGKQFIRTSEKDGFNHIYLINENGKSKQVTKGNWDVIEFKGMNEKEGIIYYTSAEEGPQYAALYTIGKNGKNKKKISEKRGTNEPTFSEGMKYFVNRWSDINTPQVYSLHKADGTLIETLEENEFLQLLLEELDFHPKEFITLKGAETDLNAWILYPQDFDSTKQYPVYFHVYGGPGHNTVKDRYDGGNGAYHQLLAQKGYIVISVDPRGTMFRGAEFKKSTYLQLGKLETEDLIAAAKNIKKWPFVDTNRIGIMGWSYGGYMASLAITKGADDFKMAIAVAPVTNWRYYDNIYTERFMRTPAENGANYDDNSPINHVEKLKGKYFLIHGSADDNVHLQNTQEMIKALVAADKDFDLFVYPDKNHGIHGGNTRNHLYRMLLDYTLKNL